MYTSVYTEERKVGSGTVVSLKCHINQFPVSHQYVHLKPSKPRVYNYPQLFI